MEKYVNFSSLLGKTLVSISGKVGGDRIDILTTEGDHFVLYHEQDCCECVTIEDINGDLQDLVGNPLLQAEESVSSEPLDGKPYGYDDDYSDSFTWTFYKLATIKGYVTIRWLGTSNGYYSESVSFVHESKAIGEYEV